VKLLIDAGNRRIKWAVLRGTELGAAAGVLLDRERPALPDMLFAAGVPDSIFISNVAGPHVAAVLRDRLADSFAIEPCFITATAHAFGVRNAYEQPAQLGADRWAAMIGAFVEHGGPLCVVDAGTAFTIDVVAADGSHLGGLIVPGLELMSGCLRANTSDLAALERATAATGAPELARNTADAMRAGPRFALAALIESTVARMERRLGADLRIVMTGGDAEDIGGALARHATYNPALVLRGLAEFARGGDA
jgi:type III pantothenate kinase